jgi:HTH-type transcriptional regulator / antitoxin HigA
MNIKPIRNEQDYTAALAEIECLWESSENTSEGDKLEVLVDLVDLVDLVEMYEMRHHSLPSLDPVEAIQFAMEKYGLTHKDLEIYLGSRSKVTNMLNRKCNLSITMVRKLHQGLHIPLESLIKIV